MTIIPFKGKNMEQKFSDTARSERHFSAMLLPHLLLANNFAGLRALFRSLDRFKGADVDSNDIEIVAELNPIRDIDGEPNDLHIKQSVPDLFFRIGENVLVIEAKFFTYPSKKEIVEQLNSQREAIESVLNHTCYTSDSIHFLALTAHELSDSPTFESDMSHLTWRKVIEILEKAKITADSPDLKHVLIKLNQAVERSNTEQSKSDRPSWKVCKTIQELYQCAPELLAQGYRSVGFSEGQNEKLQRSNLEYLETRHEYRYSKRNPGGNWLPMEAVLLRYLELKKANS